MPELNRVDSCVCGPIVPPLSCEFVTSPTPDPAEHVVGTPELWDTYILVRAVVPTSQPPSEDGFEYYFECIEDPAYDSGWRSNDSVAGLYYPDGNSPEIPELYCVACDPSYSFRIKVRDAECQKETQWSQVRSVANPQS